MQIKMFVIKPTDHNGFFLFFFFFAAIPLLLNATEMEFSLQEMDATFCISHCASAFFGAFGVCKVGTAACKAVMHQNHSTVVRATGLFILLF